MRPVGRPMPRAPGAQRRTERAVQNPGPDRHRRAGVHSADLVSARRGFRRFRRRGRRRLPGGHARSPRRFGGRPGLDLNHGVRSVTGCLWGTGAERPERAGRPLTRRIGANRGLGRRYRTSTSEPQVISAPPKTTLKSAGSPKSRMDRKMVRATLSLSMGATLDTSPICSALK